MDFIEAMILGKTKKSSRLNLVLSGFIIKKSILKEMLAGWTVESLSSQQG